MQTEMRTSMQREAVAHLTAMDLFKIIDYFKVDANTILNVAESKKETSIDYRLELMDCSKRAYFQKIFNEMLDNAEMLVS